MWFPCDFRADFYGFLDFSRGIKSKNPKNEAVKGVKRGIFSLFPSEDPPPALRSKGIPLPKNLRNMQGCTAIGGHTEPAMHGTVANVRAKPTAGRYWLSLGFPLIK